ncbi:hypothetical protein MKX41_02295 [Paenibacillus sp. FSL R5-0475]|uniref:hypothetical protein n=1 Tax=Paenibacillus sp. FSL R5-0475 TaxID=2921643 RepID=UPI0030FA3BD7
MGLSDDIRQADEEKTLLFIENKKREEQVAQAKTSVFSVFKKVLSNIETDGIVIGSSTITNMGAVIYINDTKIEVSFSPVYKAIELEPYANIVEELENIVLKNYRIALGLPF